MNISTGNLTVLGYELITDTIQSDDWVRLKLYIRGSASGNAYLFVKALYPLNGDVLGGIDEYPGMMPTQSMRDDLIYAIPVRFRLDATKLATYSAPYQTQIIFGWRALAADHSLGGIYLPLQQGNGSSIQTPILAGPILLNSNPPFPKSW